jgi:hypothetical protein
MSEVITLLVAIAVPVIALAGIAGLIAGVRDLEGSRDELLELDRARR